MKRVILGLRMGILQVEQMDWFHLWRKNTAEREGMTYFGNYRNLVRVGRGWGKG